MQVRFLADYPQEVGTIANWYYNEWGHKDPKVCLATIRDKVLLGASKDRIPLAFFIKMSEEVVGAGEIKYRDLPDFPGYQYWLDGIYVPAEHRGKGISTRLIEFAKEKASELGLPSLHLSCEAHNVKLYENRGFKLVRESSDRFIMEYSITTS